MLPQVILVMRTPFKGKGTIRAQEGTHSGVDTLMDLDLDKYRYVKSLYLQAFHLPDRILVYKTLTSHLEQRGAFEGFAAVLTFVRLLPRVRPAKE